MTKVKVNEDKQDFRIEDEVTKDSAEQIEVKQYQFDECEYDIKYISLYLTGEGGGGGIHPT